MKSSTDGKGTGKSASTESGDGAERADWPIAGEALSVWPQAVFLLADGKITYANAEASRLVPEPLLKQPFATVFGEVDAECARTLAEMQTPLDLDLKTGSGRWIAVQARSYQKSTIVTCRDITEQKLLADRTEELSDFLENASVPMHWVGPDGTILRANQAELRALGYSAEEYIGHSIAEFHVDEPVIADILRRLTNDEVLDNYEARLRCKNGAILTVAINSSVYRKDGKFIHTRCLTRDLSSERLAAELEKRLAAIVESSDDAILSKDLNGMISSWNRGAESLFGYTAEEAIGKPISMLAPPDRIEEISNILERVGRGERVDPYQTKRTTKDGRILWISLTVSPIMDAAGNIIGASKVARDITHRIQSEEALQAANDSLTRANADLEQFAYSASHDLQEPLRMVLAYSELLKKRYGGQLSGDGDEFIGYLVEGATRMEHLLHDLRTFTQSAAIDQEDPRGIDANECLLRTIGNLKTTISDNGATITHDRLPVLMMHEFQLEQLFQNLIANAIRYHSQAPPIIHVGAKRVGQYWELCVRDNGMGVDPKYKEQIFGIFKRLHTSSEVPGTGMGLAICQRIVEGGGGRIWMESEPGGGSTFFFTVPAGQGN